MLFEMTATCPFIRAHWRHLANRIECVHPSAHSSPQPKRQMDRFSRFCTAYDKKCVYFTMSTPVHQNCPFPWGIWTSHVTHNAFGPCESTIQMAPRSVQSSCTDDSGVSILYNGLPVSPVKIAPSHVGIWISCNTWFTGPTGFPNANDNLIAAAVFCMTH